MTYIRDPRNRLVWESDGDWNGKYMADDGTHHESAKEAIQHDKEKAMTDERKEGQQGFDRHSKEPAFNAWYEKYAHWDSTEEAYEAWKAAQPEPRGSEALVETALRNAVGLADALDAIIGDFPQVAQYLPGLASCRKNIEAALLAAATAERTLLLKKLANGWIETGQLGTGLRGDEYVTAHKEAIMGIYEHCGKSLLEYLAYADRQPAPLVAKPDTTPTRAMIEAEPRDWLPELKQNPLDVAYNAIWKLWDKDPENQQLVLALQAIQRIGQPAPPQPEALKAVCDAWWKENGGKRLDEVYESGWQAAIEAAAQLVASLDDEWLDRSAEGVAYDIRSLRPSPAPPQKEGPVEEKR